MSEFTTFPVPPAQVNALAVANRCDTAPRQGRAFEPDEGLLARVWPRLILVLLALMALKVFLIGGQGESLYETHWRTGGMLVTRLNEIAFYAFVVLGGLSLVRLGRSCQSLGIRSVRTTNGVVLMLGLSFVLLTFHNGDKNYLYPILNGVLQWSSLVSYLANALFFNEPFLAVWLFVYVACYYVMARTGREASVLRLTAAFACAYALINLRDFIAYRNELQIVDCLGAVSLLMAWRSSRQESARFPAGWLLLPLVWAVFFVWAVLRFDTTWQSLAANYFLSLAGTTLALFVAGALLIRRSGDPAAWTWLLGFFFVAFFLFADTNYPCSVNYNHLICLALTSPRYFMGELALVGLLGLGVWLQCKFRPHGGLWWLDLAGLGLIIVAGLDLRLSQIMGVRLGWDVLAFGDSPKMMLKLAKPYLPGAIAGLVVAGLAYALIVRGIRFWSARRSAGAPTFLSAAWPGFSFARETAPGSAQLPAPRGQESPRPATRRPAGFYLAAMFITLALLGVATAEPDKAADQAVLRLVRTSPLWKRVTSRTLNREEFLKSASSLGLGDFGSRKSMIPIKPPRDLNVVVVFMESSYNKHLALFGSSEETQPLLTKYRDRMELFPNFFSAFTGSIHARFATFTSLYPMLDFHAFTQERVPVKSLFEVLHDHGYTCSVFYSSFFDYTGFRDFLKNRSLDEMYDADTMPGPRKTEPVAWGLLEEETLGAMRNQLKKYAQSHQRFCLTYIPAAPHNPYDRIPKPFQKYKMKEVGDLTPLYLNELLYMDWVLASIMDELKASGLLEHTLVVITNDHGEMLGGKDGQIGHGWKLTPELANTPLILMDPERPGFQVNKTIGTQVDLLPTILDRLNIPVPADQLYEGLSLDAGADRVGRRGYLNSYRDFGIVSGDQLLLGDRDRSDPSGVAATGGGYRITNEGPKTVFTEEEGEGTVPNRQAAMSRFDAFQESLLRNYSVYCASIRGTPQQLAKRSGN